MMLVDVDQHLVLAETFERAAFRLERGTDLGVGCDVVKLGMAFHVLRQ